MGGGSSKNKTKGHLLDTLHDHDGSITCMTLSEDGSLLVTGSYDMTAKMWSTMSEPTECLGVLKGHTGRIWCVTMKGTFVFTGSEDKTIRKWDMCTSDCLFTYSGHVQQVHRIICSGDFMFSTSYDKTARVWDLHADDVMESEEACVRILEGHQMAIYPIIFIPGDDTGGLNEEGLHINPRDLVITGSTDTTARSWSLDMGICIKTFKQHRGSVSCMDTDPTGKLLYTGSDDCTVNVWDINSGRCLKTLDDHKGSVTCLKVVNKLLYTGSADSKVKCWVREFGDCTRTYKINKSEGGVVCFKFYRGILFVGYTDHSARAYDAKSGSMKRDYRGHTDSINCLTVAGNKLYTASSDGSLRVWDASKVSDETTSEGDDSEEEENKPMDLDKYLDKYLGDDVDPVSKPEDSTPV
ncbi:WD repeat-containing protein 86-like isoform X2 [Homarus americanus]|uniref:WD repeat-containing protein 86-like isoform X2 n=1 Tax=Homarus americanus TaxID=6706 RepID=UPI001C454938|nr:WD repeat-containing protein 86-like isoform X2 [Homarus americanus]